MTRSTAAPLSATEILKRYRRREHQVSPSQPTSHSEPMTPSARYVAREAKARLAARPWVSGDTPSFSAGGIAEMVHSVESAAGEVLSEDERASVISALEVSSGEFGLLTPLIESHDINDIIVASYHNISVQRGRLNQQTDFAFPDHDAYLSYIENLLRRVGKASTAATPVVDAAIGSRIRLCVTHESFSPPGMGPTLTIRIARHPTVSLATLHRRRLAPAPVLEYLAALIQSGQATVLISGEVSTGKTTLARALASEIPLDESVLVIEDTHELALDRPFTRTLLTREANTEGAGRIAPSQAIRAGLRMAMNRIILGELRDAQAAEAFIDVCTSGHPGVSTIHAKGVRDALARLELLLLRAYGHVGVDPIRRHIAQAVSCVVHLGSNRDSRERRVLEVAEIQTAADGNVQLAPMFRLCDGTDEGVWKRGAGISAFPEALRRRGCDLLPPGSVLRLHSDGCSSTEVE
ncbi:MAG: CpaF family protein [Deltaproteobacteria bacterium]|nr:CpaF family protein [Deltaproteobacteria bacterium]